MLLEINQLDGWDVSSLDVLRQGVTLACRGDGPAYARFRTATLARFADTSNPVVAERTLKICLLQAADGGMVKALGPLADRAAAAFASQTSDNPDAVFHAAWGAVSLALMEYRRGKYARAVEWCRRSQDYSEDNQPRNATVDILLAMADQRRGRTEDARAELSQGRELVDAKFKAGLERGDGELGFWFDWVFARILLQEADGGGRAEG